MKQEIYLFNNRSNRALAKKYANSRKYRNTIIILMAMPLAIHSVIGVLGIPVAMSKRGARADEILLACTDNEFVAIDDAKIEIVQEQIDNFKAAKGRARREPWRIVQNSLFELMGLFRVVAANNPDNAISIFYSGKFKVKEVSPHQKQKFDAKNGLTLGSVVLTAQGGGQRTCHDWMYSSDGITFVRLTPTINANTVLSGLPVGKYAYFTHELITKDGGEGVSQIIKVMVG